jgi:hypothetical protein
VVAQSIGGGGGTGGVAASSTSTTGLSTGLTVGGSGGATGAGGNVGLILHTSSSISTGSASSSGARTGYAAFGILAQSIGGGGGTGVDGSTASLLNITLGGRHRRQQQLRRATADQVSITGGQASITTQGDVAAGLVLQSIGGGGGVAGSGNSAPSAAGDHLRHDALHVGGIERGRWQWRRPSASAIHELRQPSTSRPRAPMPMASWRRASAAAAASASRPA